MKKIKIISDKHPDACKLAMQTKHGFISSGWYLHGELESLFKYDLAEFVEAPLQYSEVIFKDDNKPCKVYYLEDGIYDVEVIGCNDKCTGYFWVEFKKYDNIIGEYPEMRGLVVMNCDLPSVEYASKKYKERASRL